MKHTKNLIAVFLILGITPASKADDATLAVPARPTAVRLISYQQQGTDSDDGSSDVDATFSPHGGFRTLISDGKQALKEEALSVITELESKANSTKHLPVGALHDAIEGVFRQIEQSVPIQDAFVTVSLSRSENANATSSGTLILHRCDYSTLSDAYISCQAKYFIRMHMKHSGTLEKIWEEYNPLFWMDHLEGNGTYFLLETSNHGRDTVSSDVVGSFEFLNTYELRNDKRIVSGTGPDDKLERASSGGGYFSAIIDESGSQDRIPNISTPSSGLFLDSDSSSWKVRTRGVFPISAQGSWQMDIDKNIDKTTIRNPEFCAQGCLLSVEEIQNFRARKNPVEGVFPSPDEGLIVSKITHWETFRGFGVAQVMPNQTVRVGWGSVNVFMYDRRQWNQDTQSDSSHLQNIGDVVAWGLATPLQNGKFIITDRVKKSRRLETTRELPDFEHPGQMLRTHTVNYAEMKRTGVSSGHLESGRYLNRTASYAGTGLAMDETGDAGAIAPSFSETIRGTVLQSNPEYIQVTNVSQMDPEIGGPIPQILDPFMFEFPEGGPELPFLREAASVPGAFTTYGAGIRWEESSFTVNAYTKANKFLPKHVVVLMNFLKHQDSSGRWISDPESDGSNAFPQDYVETLNYKLNLLRKAGVQVDVKWVRNNADAIAAFQSAKDAVVFVIGHGQVDEGEGLYISDSDTSVTWAEIKSSLTFQIPLLVTDSCCGARAVSYGIASKVLGSASYGYGGFEPAFSRLIGINGSPWHVVSGDVIGMIPSPPAR